MISDERIEEIINDTWDGSPNEVVDLLTELLQHRDAAIPLEAQQALEFLKRAAKMNCRIVCSCDLTLNQIAEARVFDRFFVDEWGFGYALMPWELTTTKDEERLIRVAEEKERRKAVEFGNTIKNVAAQNLCNGDLSHD